MNHEELLKEIKDALNYKFDSLERTLLKHDTKLDEYVQRITKVEADQQTIKAKVNWLYGLVATIAAGCVAWATKVITGA